MVDVDEYNKEKTLFALHRDRRIREYNKRYAKAWSIMVHAKKNWENKYGKKE
ncbi:MAG: hypothetical protein KJ847_02470 [Firmicutes bacterium]|nr:hypothetical protein [Bacillota bacterium]